MPTWQLTIAFALLLLATGTVTIIGSRRKQTLLEGYAAWIIAVAVTVTQWYRKPNAFAPLAKHLAGLRNAVAKPAVAVATIWVVILMAQAAAALLDKNARLFAASQPLGDIRLDRSQTAPEPQRSGLRRVIDRFRSRKPHEPELDVTAEPPAEAAGTGDGGAAWRSMLSSERICNAFGITTGERDMLSQVSFMGEVSSPHDLHLVLNVLRSARANLASEIESGAQEPPTVPAAPVTDQPPCPGRPREA